MTTSFEWYQFKELRQLQNSKKPFNTHLIWGHSIYGILFVDSADQTVLLKTIDKGVTVTTVTTTHGKKIQMGWLDTNDLWLVCCNNPDDEFTVVYIELDNSDNEVDVGDSFGAPAGTCYALDIYKIGSDFYVNESRVDYYAIWIVTSAPFSIEADRVLV